MESPIQTPTTPPKKRRGSGQYLTTEDVIMAMLTFKSDRRLAAKHLDITKAVLDNKISTIPALKARFGRTAIAIKKKEEIRKMEEGGEDPRKLEILDMSTQEMAAGQIKVAQVALERLYDIKKRLTLGNEAKEIGRILESKRTPEQQEKFLKWSFGVDEEKLLLNQEIAMMQEYTNANDVMASTSYKRAQTEALMRKTGNSLRSPRGKLATPPKGHAPQEQQLQKAAAVEAK